MSHLFLRKKCRRYECRGSRRLSAHRAWPEPNHLFRLTRAGPQAALAFRPEQRRRSFSFIIALELLSKPNAPAMADELLEKARDLVEGQIVRCATSHLRRPR